MKAVSPIKLPFDFSLAEPLALLEQKKALTLVNVGNAAAKAYLVAQLFEKTNFQSIFWAFSEDKVETIHLNADLFFDGDVLVIPAELDWPTLYQIYDRLSDQERSYFLFENYTQTLSQSIPTRANIEAETITFTPGEKIKIFEIFESLGRKGYTAATDQILEPGQFVRRGENLFIYPINTPECYRVELFGDEVEAIARWDQVEKKPTPLKKTDVLSVFPIQFESPLTATISDLIEGADRPIFIADDLEEVMRPGEIAWLKFTTFPQNEEDFYHLNFFSVLPFYTVPDFVTDTKERFRRDYRIAVMTKRRQEVENIFRENDIMWTNDPQKAIDYPSTVYLIDCQDQHFLPHSFQNNDQKIIFLTDREIFQFKRSSRQKKAVSAMNLELINSLKPNDYVIHADHGIALFEAMVRRELGGMGEREFLKLCYAGSDRLYIPVESAEKVTKYIGDENPRLSKLGGGEWQKTQKKLKKEAEVIAKDLLRLYAKREMATGKPFESNDDMMNAFCDAFPYELTPGQAEVWEQIRIDMERPRPMDRLVCGDVGFGKTEMAMRAAFKCFRSGRQCAILAPITILAEQHYESFIKRIENHDFGVRVALLSRFQSAAEQKKILKDIETGLVDIVIGTHRLLSGDIKFKQLGLLIIDEEQRFGVKQKERLKEVRANVDLLTLTATPIPRTLHLSLNKLKDISTITTPPPGRLPVVTEVRKFNPNLIREQILKEINRGGQVYFLHNTVKTIEGQAEQLRALVPEATFIVAHGQLSPQELESRVKKFKDGEAQVLVASTIIENGIDLAKANTLFVNKADNFGLAQLYQLRGRVGRSRTQAYAYFLYHGQKLDVDAKKRLRAIVEASELGAGFQIAMKDLEIRGAGEVLGANQSGAMKDAGVSHFIRLLNKTVEEMKSGKQSMEDNEEAENVTVEFPVPAYIPPHFIPNADEKIQVYQELASCDTEESLRETLSELESDYGTIPREVENLGRVIRTKILLKKANISGAKIHKASHKHHELILRFGKNFKPDQVFNLLKYSKWEWIIGASNLKVEWTSLPIGWYQELISEIQHLIPVKK